MKRVLLIHNYYQQWGGEDTVFEAECELLRAKGHSVDVLTFHNNDMLSRYGKLKAALNVFYNSSAARQLKLKIRDFRPDVIHIHNFFPMGSPALFKVARQYKLPVFMTLHNFRLICSNALLFRDGKPCEACVGKIFPLTGIKKSCYRDSKLQTLVLTAMVALHKMIGTWKQDVNCYIALNPFARQKILDSSLSLSGDRVMVKPNFVSDPTGSDVRLRIGYKDNFLLYAGRLSVEKGIHTLLEAYMKHGDLPPLKIIGAGPLEEQVMRYAETNPNVEYLGFQKREVILDLMAKAKAVLLTSTWYENCPMVILESLACATPVIASNIGALPGIIQDGYNGFLVEPSSSDDLAEKIRGLEKVDLTVLSQNARATYLEKYSPEGNYRQLMDIYSSV